MLTYQDLPGGTEHDAHNAYRHVKRTLCVTTRVTVCVFVRTRIMPGQVPESKMTSFKTIDNVKLYPYVCLSLQLPSNSITKTPSRKQKIRYDIDTKQVRVYLFRLEEYDKIIYLDTRSLVLKPLHNLFELPDTPLASSIAYWESENRFTESLLIVRPSKALFDEMSSNQQDDDITVLTKYFEHRLPESRNFPDVLMLPGTFVVAESSLDDTKGVFDDMSSATLESEANILRFESDPWISSSSRESKSSRMERFYDMFFEEYSNPLSTNDDPPSTNDGILVVWKW